MEKYIFDENNGLWYELQGEYYIPCLKLPEQETKERDDGKSFLFVITCISQVGGLTDNNSSCKI